MFPRSKGLNLTRSQRKGHWDRNSDIKPFMGNLKRKTDVKPGKPREWISDQCPRWLKAQLTMDEWCIFFHLFILPLVKVNIHFLPLIALEKMVEPDSCSFVILPVTLILLHCCGGSSSFQTKQCWWSNNMLPIHNSVKIGGDTQRILLRVYCPLLSGRWRPWMWETQTE